MTVLNLFLTGLILWQMFGKKLNPHQAYEDRTRQIGLKVKILVFVSIAATIFISMNIVLAALEMRDLQPFKHSLYFQLLGVVCFLAYRLDNINFEVCKEEPLVT